MDFFYYYNEIVYNHDFVIFSLKIDNALLEYEVLDSNVCLYDKDYYKILLFGVKNFTIKKILTIFNNAIVFNCNIITF